MNQFNKIIQGDTLEVLKTFPDESIDMSITSPPYWGLRDYGVEGQLGLEKTPEEYVANMVKVFGDVRRVLKKEGTLWLNLGDSYGSSTNRNGMSGSQFGYSEEQKKGVNRKFEISTELKPKDLVGIPWRVAFALQADGWWLRQDIIWAKPNPMPESVTDRCTKSHEYIFLLAKSQKYYFDNEAIKEASKSDKQPRFRDNGVSVEEQGKRIGQGNITANCGVNDTRNKRSVWTVTTKPYKGAHFATFPPDLIEPMVKAGCPKGGVVLDPFFGSGTTGVVAKKLGRNYVGIELNPKYIEIAKKRLNKVPVRLDMIIKEMKNCKHEWKHNTTGLSKTTGLSWTRVCQTCGLEELEEKL